METRSRNLESRLAALADKGAAAQITLETEFDWRRKAVLPPLLPRRVYTEAISQLYYGECSTQQMCRQLRGRLDHPQAARCLEIQEADETRHGEAYRRYLDKIGGLAGPEPEITAAFEAVLAWQGAPEATILAFHILVEGEALNLQKTVERWLPCPLFAEISARFAHDEARHIAFGTLYLQHSLPHLPWGERLAIYQWLEGLWTGCALAVLDRYRAPGLFGRQARTSWVQRRWRQQAETLQSLGLFDENEAVLILAQ